MEVEKLKKEYLRLMEKCDKFGKQSNLHLNQDYLKLRDKMKKIARLLDKLEKR